MNEVTAEKPDAQGYEIVGWLSITSAVLMFPSIVLGLILELGRKPFILVLLLPYTLIFCLSIGLSLYALYRFKGLLNDRFQFHEVDNLITAIIILALVLTVVGTGVKVVGTFVKVNAGDSPVLIIMAMMVVAFFLIIGLPLSIISIIFAVKLLRLRDDLYGLLKPYAYTSIVASALFATFIFSFLGFFVDAACSVMLGLIFIRASRGAPSPEFV